MKTLNLFFNIETNLIFIINYDLNNKYHFFNYKHSFYLIINNF